MSQILEIYNAVAERCTVVFCAVCAVLLAVLFVNLSVNPYKKYFRQMRKAVATLKKGKKTTEKNIVAGVYSAEWQNYKNGADVLPSQCLRFKQYKIRKYLLVVCAICVAFVLPLTVISAVKNVYGMLFFVPILLLCQYVTTILCVCLAAYRRKATAFKKYEEYVALLDFYYGKNFFNRSNERENFVENPKADVTKQENEARQMPIFKESALRMDTPETEKKEDFLSCVPFSAALKDGDGSVTTNASNAFAGNNLKNSDCDDAEDVKVTNLVPDDVATAKKAAFLASNGLNAETAKKIASLLREDNAPRSAETQKQLNKVLNGAFQTIAKKQENKILNG